MSKAFDFQVGQRHATWCVRHISDACPPRVHVSDMRSIRASLVMTLEMDCKSVMDAYHSLRIDISEFDCLIK